MTNTQKHFNPTNFKMANTHNIHKIFQFLSRALISKEGIVFRLILMFILLSGYSYRINAANSGFHNESLRYVISYKWGLIHKDAGEAVLSLKKSGDRYDIKLIAKTKPWADKVYKVRDTLIGAVTVKDLKPIYYSKITHEKGKYARDDIRYKVSGNTTLGNTSRIRIKQGKESVNEKTLSATGPVYDMLSVFYYLRKLDYAQLNKNKIYTATVFSGSKKEIIKIKSLGIEKIKLKDNSTREAYHIKFNFTQEGGKKSSDDIDTWISTDSDHIPLYLVGKLPIGEVRAYFLGK